MGSGVREITKMMGEGNLNREEWLALSGTMEQPSQKD